MIDWKRKEKKAETVQITRPQNRRALWNLEAIAVAPCSQSHQNCCWMWDWGLAFLSFRPTQTNFHRVVLHAYSSAVFLLPLPFHFSEWYLGQFSTIFGGEITLSIFPNFPVGDVSIGVLLQIFHPSLRAEYEAKWVSTHQMMMVCNL